jgi:hypothetical protein
MANWSSTGRIGRWPTSRKFTLAKSACADLAGSGPARGLEKRSSIANRYAGISISGNRRRRRSNDGLHSRACPPKAQAPRLRQTLTVFYSACWSRNGGISCRSIWTSAPELRCPGRTCHNEIRKLACPQNNRTGWNSQASVTPRRQGRSKVRPSCLRAAFLALLLIIKRTSSPQPSSTPKGACICAGCHQIPDPSASGAKSL